MTGIPDGRFGGSVALVSGGASGIGEAACRRLAAEGARVVVADIDDVRAAQVAESLGGVDAAPVHLDVTEPDSVGAAIDFAEAEFGGLDVVVANAGLPCAVPLEDLTLEQWNQAFAVNTSGVFLLAQAAVGLLRNSPAAAVVVTASLAGLHAMPRGQVAYCSAKGAAVSMVRALALELTAERIRVNSVCPGFVETPMLHRFLRQAHPDAVERAAALQAIGEAQTMGRICQPSEIAAAIAFLASSDASYINGVNLPVDGGTLAMRE